MVQLLLASVLRGTCTADWWCTYGLQRSYVSVELYRPKGLPSVPVWQIHICTAPVYLTDTEHANHSVNTLSLCRIFQCQSMGWPEYVTSVAWIAECFGFVRVVAIRRLNVAESSRTEQNWDVGVLVGREERKGRKWRSGMLGCWEDEKKGKGGSGEVGC